MPTTPAPDTSTEWCTLIRRDEQKAALRQRYETYVARFERWDNRKGWLRFIVGNPVAALGAVVSRKPLPVEWCRAPLSEEDFVHELFLGNIQRMAPRD